MSDITQHVERFTNLSVLLMNGDGDILYSNKGFSRLYNYSVNVAPKSISELFEDEYAYENYLSFVKDVIRHQSSTAVLEFKRIRYNSEPVHVGLLLLYWNVDGDDAILEISFNITNKIKLESDLRNAIIVFSKLNELNEILYSTHSSREIIILFLIFLMLPEGFGLENVGYLEIRGEKPRLFTPTRELLTAVKDNSGLFSGGITFKRKITSLLRRCMSDEKSSFSATDISPVVVDPCVEIFRRNRQSFNPGEQQSDIFITLLDELRRKSGLLMKAETTSWLPLFAYDDIRILMILDVRNTIYEKKLELSTLLHLFHNHLQLAFTNSDLYGVLQDRLYELQSAYKSLEMNQKKLIRFERFAAVGELTAQIAHEIKNPLVSIGGFARLIEKKSEEIPEIKKYANIIVNEVNRLEQILKSMLDYIKPEQIKLKTQNLNKLIYSTLELVKENLENGYIIEFLPDRKCPLLKLDEEKIHQVLINLLKNSLQAMPDGGKITIKTEYTHDKQVKLIVADQGTGIPQQVKSKLFQPFITTKTDGTGLGLAISKKILDAHDAKINFKSMKPKGTLINITFKPARSKD
ncbi:MAG: hypothetical protein Kow00108_02520 [Calditrichia bacterium]